MPKLLHQLRQHDSFFYQLPEQGAGFVQTVISTGFEFQQDAAFSGGKPSEYDSLRVPEKNGGLIVHCPPVISRARVCRASALAAKPDTVRSTRRWCLLVANTNVSLLTSGGGQAEHPGVLLHARRVVLTRALLVVTGGGAHQYCPRVPFFLSLRRAIPKAVLPTTSETIEKGAT